MRTVVGILISGAGYYITGLGWLWMFGSSSFIRDQIAWTASNILAAFIIGIIVSTAGRAMDAIGQRISA